VSWLFAQLYERGSRKQKTGPIDGWRHELLAQAAGEVVEIGAGNGLNLKHYTDAVTRLVLTEPNQHMRAHLRTRLQVPDGAEVELSEGYAEAIPLPDNSVDTVVSTLVLCSVKSQAAALAEAQRVLRPGGRFLFLEHVGADDPGKALLQRVMKPLCGIFADGCNPTRNTLGAMEAAGFEIEGLQRSQMPGLSGRFAPTIQGSAKVLDR